MNRFRTRVCLGISVESTAGFKLATLGTKDLQAPWPLELRSFASLEGLDEYWLDWFRDQYRLDRVGVVLPDSEDLGLLEWLESYGIESEHYSVPTFTFHPTAERYKVPGAFEMAYDQAFACLLRAQAKEFTSLVTSEARRLENGLRETIARLECLEAALSYSDHCPF